MGLHLHPQHRAGRKQHETSGKRGDYRGRPDRRIDGLGPRRRQLADSVVGIGRRQVGLHIARRVGAVTETTVHLSKGVARADLVVVCTPVLFIADFVREAAKHCPEGTLITDVGSTKQALAEALDEGLPRGCRFSGSHPIAGSEKTGATSADAELFEGRVAVLTPTRNTRAEDFDFLERVLAVAWLGGRAPWRRRSTIGRWR